MGSDFPKTSTKTRPDACSACLEALQGLLEHLRLVLWGSYRLPMSTSRKSFSEFVKGFELSLRYFP